MNSLVLNPDFGTEDLLVVLEGDAATLLGSEERGVDDVAVAARAGFFCVTLVQSLMV